MNSSALYLAIVVVWLLVLVPMLLRRDAANPDHALLDRADPIDDSEHPDEDPDADQPLAAYPSRTDDTDDTPYGAHQDPSPDPDRTQVLSYDEYFDGDHTEPADAQNHGQPRHEVHAAPSAPPPPAERTARPPLSRAKVIARRRRRTTGLTTLLAGTGVAVGFDLGPWWVLVPPVILLTGHLALLREAAKVDAQRRTAMLQRRRRHRAERRKQAHRAEVIHLPAPRDQEVYDQYTDAHLRAAGD